MDLQQLKEQYFELYKKLKESKSNWERKESPMLMKQFVHIERFLIDNRINIATGASREKGVFKPESKKQQPVIEIEETETEIEPPAGLYITNSSKDLEKAAENKSKRGRPKKSETPNEETQNEETQNESNADSND